ncbi:choice-of-anchor I family protein [Paradesertivirga mongoliensis]|uniref:Choice-of-anchor I family protein n=1 Tax=Paradesertivirga mongoliensis TaxID=2100740 RepID=A0ABW4ZGX9_9SPHI|nr:choice-of-anchor I family protein [Pedobacter mongoliensis]
MKSFKSLLFLISVTTVFFACKKNNGDPFVEPEQIVPENPATFREVSTITLGTTGAAEISTYDPKTKKLFVVNNAVGSKVDVIDLSAFPTITKSQTLDFSTTSGVANSVAVSNGLLAVALEASIKTDNGAVAILNTSTLTETRRVTVGALPDMVTFSPDGNYIVTANEGEPNSNYTVDPVGSISVIDIKNNYSVRTLDFTSFESSLANLKAAGFRMYGLNATFAKDIEPEYVTIAADSKKAWVTLQENNAVAEVDLIAGTILRVVPLGVKDISLSANAFDISDQDNKMELGTWPVKAFYLPDAISMFSLNNVSYLALANEGDTRDYGAAFNEEVRVSALTLDPTRFPTAATLKLSANAGRLTVTRFNGDTDGDGDFDELYTTGGRSVSIINASNGQLVAEIGKDLEQRVIAAGKYDDGRSDNKGVEVEAVTVNKVNGQMIAFIGMERADMIAVYDVSNPMSPVFLQLFATGDAPEGLLYIKPKDSPNGRSILVVSSEGDGSVKLYQPDKI